jgi:hypothetical protein
VLWKMGDELTTALEKLAQLLVAKNVESTSAEGGCCSCSTGRGGAEGGAHAQ